MTGLAIHSPRLDLAWFGVVPRKGLTAVLPDEIRMNRDVWRGIVDGDGHVREIFRAHGGRYAMLGLCGGHALMTQFRDFVRSIYPCRATIYHAKGELCEIKLAGGAASAVLSALYENATVYLDRKYAAAIRGIALGRHHRWHRWKDAAI